MLSFASVYVAFVVFAADAFASPVPVENVNALVAQDDLASVPLIFNLQVVVDL
tara:strand:+ start:222 stop:380 length:159 start_codon:yes stop_codon:yes gene_type:complete